jgi:hypothetical protein
VLSYTLQCTRKEGVLLDKKKWYELVLKPVQASPEGQVTVLWNQQVQNDGNTPNNKPDIIIRDNEKGKFSMLLDVAISGDRNVVKKAAEKILIYAHLKTKYSPCGLLKQK